MPVLSPNSPASDRIGPRIESCEPRLQFSTLPSGFNETILATGLTSPTGIDVAPDGRVFLNDQSGHVRIIQKNKLLSTPFADFGAKVDSSNERGMMGLTLDPQFGGARPYVYVFYTLHGSTSHNRVSRLTVDPANPNRMLAGSEKVLIDLPDLTPASIWHMGGALQFGKDGKLYVCVGDQMEKTKAQDAKSVLGKVLRINSDGSIPSDNPYYGSNTGIARAVWASGLRNPFTAAVQPGTGRLFINDVGAQAAEEIDEGARGANFGWPLTEGKFNQSSYPSFTQPFYAYAHVGDLSAITAGTFYNPPGGGTFGASYVGKYFFADLDTGQMWALNTTSRTTTLFATGLSYPTGFATGDDGAIYVLSRGAGAAGASGAGLGRVLKIQADSATFGAPVGYDTGTHSHGVATADFNGDGKADLVVVSTGSNRLSVLLGNGDGTFKPAVNYTAGVEPKSVMAGDLNGDGKIDLVTCSQRDNKVYVFINNGNGTFKAGVGYASPTSSHEVALADLDGDKDLDVAVCGGGQSIVRVLFNNGSGVLGSAKDYNVGSGPHSVIACDLNGDLKPDLAVADLDSNNVALLTNKGNGQFNAATYLTTASGPHSVRAADLNGDGRLDLVAAASTANKLSVLINKGGGTFAAKIDYAVGPTPKNVAIGDVNNDGRLDLLSANVANNYPNGDDPAGKTISVLLGKRDGTFASATTFNTGDTPFSIALGDFDRDGDLDAATANWHGNNVTILKNGTFTAGGPSPVAPSDTGRIAGYCFNDSNADGILNGTENKASGKFVYLDANNNNKFDSGERSMTTGDGGAFAFSGLAAGTYRVRRVFPTGYTYSTPLINVMLAAGQSVSGLAIGSKTT